MVDRMHSLAQAVRVSCIIAVQGQAASQRCLRTAPASIETAIVSGQTEMPRQDVY